MAHRSLMIPVAGVPTHLLRGGRGAPLLVLPPQFAADRWFPYHDALATRFQIFAPDHPGCGKSELPDWMSDVGDMVLHYVDLLDALRLERVSALGTSFGGWMAAELAAAYPERIDRLVLVGAAGLRVEGVERFDLFVHSVEETLRRLFQDPRRAAQLRAADSDAESVVQAYREATTLARVAWNPYFYNPKLERRLARIKARTLVLWGAEDAFLPRPHGEAYARLIPGASLEIVPGSGHLIPLEQTEIFVRRVLAFLTADD
jgi:pimeloyl-ACP methyl ester carboxylesterase